MNFDYYIPTKVLFGAGKLNHRIIEVSPDKKVVWFISPETPNRISNVKVLK